MYVLMVVVMEGSFGVGVCKLSLRLFFVIVLVVVGLKVVMSVVFCLKLGKFLKSDLIFFGLKNMSIL